MAAFEVYKSQRSPSIEDSITSAGFDFTGSTVKLRMRLEGASALKVDAAATMVDIGVGFINVRYDWAALDVDTSGRYQAWWSVTLPSGLVQDGDEFPVVVKAHDGSVSQITIDSIRDHVETGIVDEALKVLLDDAVAQVENRFGTDGAITLRLIGGGQFLRLQRPAVSVASIAESNEQRTPLYTLGALGTDYDLLYGGRMLVRLSGGTVFYYQSWAPVVDVVYTPKPEQILRDRVVVDLVKLAVQYSGLAQEQIGGRTGYQSWSIDDYHAERERLLRGVSSSRGFSYA